MKRLATWTPGCSKFASIWTLQPSPPEATSHMQHPVSEGTLHYGGVKSAKETVDQQRGLISAGCCTSTFGWRTTDVADVAMMWQSGRESIADFVFRFRATCLKIPDLSEAEKMDRFVSALAQDVRLQVELRGPQDFHEAAMFAERADMVLTRISGQDARKLWQKGHKGGFQQRPPLQNKGFGELNAQGSGGPEPMELGMAWRRTLSRDKYAKLRTENACFYCRKPNAGHVARDCPMRKSVRETGTVVRWCHHI